MRCCYYRRQLFSNATPAAKAREPMQYTGISIVHVPHMRLLMPTYTLYTMPYIPKRGLRPTSPPREGGGVHFPNPPNTPLDDINHRLEWLNTHPLVINIIQKQYYTPTMVYNNVWRATNSSSRFHIRCNTRKFKSASWYIGFTLEEQSQIPHFCGICDCSLLRGEVAEVWNLLLPLVALQILRCMLWTMFNRYTCRCTVYLLYSGGGGRWGWWMFTWSIIQFFIGIQAWNTTYKEHHTLPRASYEGL